MNTFISQRVRNSEVLMYKQSFFLFMWVWFQNKKKVLGIS